MKKYRKTVQKRETLWALECAWDMDQQTALPVCP